MLLNNPFKKYLIVFWSVFAVGILSVVVLFTLIGNGKLGYMPTLTELENVESSLASEVYTADSLVMRRYYFKENRTFISFDAISPNVIHALIATEDARFYSHPGIDLRGLFRVFKGIATGDQSAGGGSTLSQQLAKMLFPREDIGNKFQLGIRKLREWVIAVKLERNFTKEEIISMYLNKFDFLNLAVGIKSAAEIYFGTTPDKLDIEQAAMLIGMAKNPSLFNPIRRPEIVRNRRNVVLAQMEKYDYIKEAEMNSLKNRPLNLNFHKEDFKSTPGTYFTEYLRSVLTSPKPLRERYKAWHCFQTFSRRRKIRWVWRACARCRFRW